MGLTDKYKRFVKVYEEGGMMSTFAVFVDKLTGVNYIIHHGGDSESMTPLLDSNGRPVVTPMYNSDFKQ